MKITCPYCKKSDSNEQKGLWPFCSERCKNLDLGAWGNEKYKVSSKISKDTDEYSTYELQGRDQTSTDEDDF